MLPHAGAFLVAGRYFHRSDLTAGSLISPVTPFLLVAIGMSAGILLVCLQSDLMASRYTRIAGTIAVISGLVSIAALGSIIVSTTCG